MLVLIVDVERSRGGSGVVEADRIYNVLLLLSMFA
jgi:hypothetical protein